jgi:lipoyl(octanoyl) transferase
MSEPLWVVDWGLVPYEEAREAQARIAAARLRGEVADTLLLLEHPPVYTRGRRSDPAELPMGVSWYEAQGIAVRDTDRGGRVTYHGPGQLVAYPIMELRPAASSQGASATGDASSAGIRPGAAGSRSYDVHAFVRALERLMIAALADHRIEARTIEGLTGVWVDQPEGGARKIGSIGIHVSRGVTTHGLAVNVNNDLQPFEWIVPCGIDDCRMTSVSRELGEEQDLAAFRETIVSRFAAGLDRVADTVAPDRLDDAISSLSGSGIGALP